MIFHENCLPADDSHEICLICYFLEAAQFEIIIGVLYVYVIVLCSESLLPMCFCSPYYKQYGSRSVCSISQQVWLGFIVFVSIMHRSRGRDRSSEPLLENQILYTPASNLGYLAPPQDNFSWVPNCSLGPPGWETKVSSKKFWFGLCEIAWFLCQPIANSRRGVCL